jgi:2-oxoglutarate ferredoxin oxidoreductase subunit gamma
MLLDSSQFAGFEPRVRPGGIIVADTAGLSAERNREDYTLHTLPCLDIAQSMGSILSKNQIMLGAFVVITGAVPPELIEDVLNERFKAKEKVREQNLAAFRRGVELGRSVA